MSTLTTLARAAVNACFVAATCTPAKGQYFMGLGTGNSANGVSGDGSVVVGGSPGFRWTRAAGVQSLGSMQGSSSPVSAAYGLSLDGSIIVGYGASSYGTEAFRWTSTAILGLGAFNPQEFMSTAHAISTCGAVVVGYSVAGFQTQAFRWTESEGMIGLGDLPGGEQWSLAYGVSRNGAIVVGNAGSPLGSEPFRWTEELGIVGFGVQGWASAISGDGRVVVGNSDGEAFHWTAESGVVRFGVLAGHNASVARAVSFDGSIIVGNSVLGSNSEAFIWDETNGMRSLRTTLVDEYGFDLTGWTLTNAAGISDDGMVIVGYGIHNGIAEGWVANLRVCPGDALRDGIVDINDISEVLFNFGQSTSFGDTNADGIVDLADLSTVLFNFGNAC